MYAIMHSYALHYTMQSEFIGKPHAKQGQGAYILF